MSSGRDGPAISREGRGRDSTAAGKKKYNKIKSNIPAAFVMVVGIFRMLGKHTSGLYSSLIPFLKENKLQYKALNSLPISLV